MTPIGPCSGWTTRKSSSSPSSRLASQAGDVGLRLGRARVYGPHENQRVTAGSDASSSSRGASSAVAYRSVRVGPVITSSGAMVYTASMLACLYDVHGNLPALEAVLDDAFERGRDALRARRRLRAVRRLAGRDGRAAARAGERAVDPRQRRALDRRGRRGPRQPGGARRDRASPEARSATSWSPPWREIAALAARPRRADLPRLAAERRALVPPGAGGRRGRAARRRPARARAVRPHPPAVPPRVAVRGIELVNPGSVGMPFDGDTRAAYAFVEPHGARRAPAGGVRRASAASERVRAIGEAWCDDRRAAARGRAGVHALRRSRRFPCPCRRSKSSRPSRAARAPPPLDADDRERIAAGRAVVEAALEAGDGGLRRHDRLRAARERPDRARGRRAAAGQPRALARRRVRAAAPARRSCAGCCCCSRRRCGAGTPACASSSSSSCSRCSSAASRR